MEFIAQIVSLVGSVVTGENPVAVVLGLLCVYLGYQVRLRRKEVKELVAKNEQLHERIEKYLESGWRAQFQPKADQPSPAEAEAAPGGGALREDAGDKKGAE